MTSDFFTHATNIHIQLTNKLEDVAIFEFFNINNEAPVSLSLTNSAIIEMLLNQCDSDNSGDEQDVVDPEEKNACR